MSEFLMAKENGRNIPTEDKIFGISARAKAMVSERGKDSVVNASVGALLDDNGELIVLSAVSEVLKKASAEDYAPYAPIGGTPEFKEAIKKAVFGDFTPESYVETVATPGGTGAIRNVIANYTKRGESVITADWYWATYNSIAKEQERNIDTFEMVQNGAFNVKGFEHKIDEHLAKQESTLVILNTPAHNPTGYFITDEEWEKIIEISTERAEKGKKIILFVDIAYIDFAGEAKKVRQFFKGLDKLNDNILVVIGYSASKTFTFYGMRCGAMLCMTKNKVIAEEFKRVCEYSSRASWSNCNRLAMWSISQIMADEKLRGIVDDERSFYRKLLEKRGKAFEQEAEKINLEMVPFDSGFFTSIPCENPDEICAELEKEGIFLVPLKKGIRVSVASISEEKCKMLPRKIKEKL